MGGGGGGGGGGVQDELLEELEAETVLEAVRAAAVATRVAATRVAHW